MKIKVKPFNVEEISLEKTLSISNKLYMFNTFFINVFRKINI